MLIPEFIKHPVETAQTAPVTATLLLGNTAALGYVLSIQVEGGLRFAWYAALLAVGATERTIISELNGSIAERKKYETQIKEQGITEDLADVIYEEGLNGRSTIKRAMINSGYDTAYYQIKDAPKNAPTPDA